MKDYTFVDDTNNIIDLLWGDKKPKYKTDKVMILSTEYTGASVEEKLNIVSNKLKELIPKKKESFKKIRYLVSRLDDIAWILNLRGSDIPYNPVFFSFGLLYSTENGNYFHLFSNKVKFDTPELIKYLDENKIILHDYTDIYQVLSTPSSDTLTFIDKVSTNSRLFTIAKEKQGEEMCIFIDEDHIENIKSIKNEVELKGYRAANLRDSVALVKFFTWMEQELITKKRTDLNEYEIGLMNKKFREEQKFFMGESFAPICAAGPNAAIIHYEQNENLHSNMSIDQLILCDTGGQYLDGTTDITRTVHYGKPKDKEKEFYTRVLLGNLSLERCIFKKASLSNLDAIARSFLLQVAETYNHGTSHGVGHFLNVHEGPYGKPLFEGNVITNEPGYYEKDNFGIRIENMMVVVRKTPEKLGFENITLVPYERNLIDLNLISPDMVKYIDDYHKKVWNTLSPLLENDKDALNYLKRKTKSLLEKDE